LNLQSDYVVLGVLYESKWYIQKRKVTYFNSDDLETGKKKYFDNLQEWHFFKEGSTEFNPDFWETYFFSKIQDLTKDPDWDKYGETIWKYEEKENRNYIGIYKIVADELKKEK